MPVLDLHGKPRLNTTTGKVEEFNVEVNLPLVRWSAGAEIQQKGRVCGTQPTHPPRKSDKAMLASNDTPWRGSVIYAIYQV
jgi:hypothetical protein